MFFEMSSQEQHKIFTNNYYIKPCWAHRKGVCAMGVYQAFIHRKSDKNAIGAMAIFRPAIGDGSK
jgi:hypothetical protein